MHVEVEGRTFSCEVAGQGPPLLFVHGFPLDRRMWAAQVAAFSASHRVLAPDLRGFGESVAPPDVMTMDDYARDLAGLLGALGIDVPVTLCGLSMGGYVAFAFARLFRDRLARLILCDTRADADPPEKRAGRERLADEVLRAGVDKLVLEMPTQLLSATTLAERPAVVAAVREMITAASPAAVAAASRGMARRSDSTSLLPGLDVPTLVVCGEHDALTPPAVMRGLAERLPDARFVAIPAAGHLSPLENPAAVNAAVGAFLGGR